MNERRVLVTGGSGFIGTNLVQHYLDQNIPVLSLDTVSPKNRAHERVFKRVDILDGQALERAVLDFAPTQLLHMAARTDIRGKTLSEYPTNVDGVSNVIDVANKTESLDRVIFASTRLVCRIAYQPTSETDYCPPNAYGESKSVGEELVRNSDLKSSWLIVRPTSIWGPWFEVPYKDFFMTIYRNRYMHIRGHDVRKSFGFVGNSVYQLESLLASPADAVRGRTLYLADYPPIQVGEMAECIRRELGAKPIRTVSMGMLRPVATAGDALRVLGWSEPPLTRFRLNNLVTEMLYDLTPIEQLVGDLPYSMEEGVRATVRWMREHGEIQAEPDRVAA